MTDAASKTNPDMDADAGSAADLMREQRLQRNLKILIGGMSALIVAGIGAIAFKMLAFTASPRAPASGTQAAIATPAGEIALELPKGAKVVSVSVSGNRLAVHHESPTGTGIAIIDIDTGRRIADVKPQEAVPRN